MKIRIDGIKGISEEFDLGTRCLLTGPNGSGKSGIIDALHLALTGRVPSLGLGADGTQSAGKLMAICEDDATVALDYGAGSITRRVEETAKSARVVTKGDTDDDGGVPVSGTGLVWADFSRLYSASPAERRDILLAMLPRPDHVEARRWAAAYSATRAVDVLADQPHRDPDMDAPADETAKLSELGGPVAVEAMGYAASLIGNATGIEGAISALHSAAKEAARLSNSKKQAAKTITPHEGDAELAAKVPALRAAVGEAAARVAEIQQANRDASTAHAAAERRDARRAILDAEIERLSAEVDGIPAIEKEIKKATDEHGKALAASEKAVASSDLDSIKEKISEALKDAGAARSAIEEAKERGRRARVKRDSLTDECPTCGQRWPDAESREAEREAQVQTMEEAKEEISDAEDDLAEAFERKDRLSAEYEKAKAKRDAAVEKATALNLRITSMRTRLETAKHSAERIASHKAELARLALDDQDTPAKAPGPGAEVDAADRKRKAAAALDEALEAKARIDLIAQAGVEDAVLRSRILRAAHSGAVAGDAAYMRHIGQGVIDQIDSAVQAVGLGDGTMWDWTGRTFELGVVRDGKRIPLIALSKGEQVLYASALLSVFPPAGEGLKVLTLEVAEVDSKSLGGLMDSLATTDHDLIVIATCHAPRGKRDGWTWLKRGGKA